MTKYKEAGFMDKSLNVTVQGRDVKNCPKTDCIHHPVNDGNGECGCIAGEWGMYVKAKFCDESLK